MFCKDCGKPMDPSGKCAHCGSPAVPAPGVKTSVKPAGGLNVKTIAIAGVAAVVVIFGAFKIFGGGGAQSSPSATVKSFIDAADKHDVDKMISYLVPDEDISKKDLRVMKEKIKMEFENNEFNVKDYKIVDVEEDGDWAEVQYLMTVSANGEDYSEVEEESFELEKIGKKWYIDESITEFE